jgi:hypothetical protein
VPDHTTLSRRSATLVVPRPHPNTGDGAQPLHLLVDSTGLRLCGAGERRVEKHGTRARRSWRKLHLGVDAETGQIVATASTSKEVDAMRSRLARCSISSPARCPRSPPMEPYDQDGVYTDVAGPLPWRSGDCAAAPHGGAERHGCDRADTARSSPQCIAKSSRMAWSLRRNIVARPEIIGIAAAVISIPQSSVPKVPIWKPRYFNML